MGPSEVMHAWFERVWNQADESAIDQLFAPACIAHGLTSVEEGPIKGPEAFKPFYRAFRSAFPDIKIAVRQCITEGNMCAARCDVSGTHKGNGLGVPATGRPIFFTGIAMTRVEHGMIQEA